MTKRENILNYLRFQPYEEVPEHLFFTGPSDGVVSFYVPACERPVRGSGYDIFGVHWTDAFPASHYTNGQKPIYEDIEDWRDGFRAPNVEKLDWSRTAAEAAVLDRENNVVAATLLVGPFERTTCLTSFEDCLVNLITSPEDFSDLIGAVADYKIALIRKLHEVAKPDIINFHDDWGTNISTFMSVPMWREVIKPHIKRIYDAVKELGMLLVQHSCGAIAPLVEDIVEMGACGWEAQADCNDIPALKAQYGDRLRFLVGPPGPPPSQEGEDGKVMMPPTAPGYEEVPEFLFD